MIRLFEADYLIEEEIKRHKDNIAVACSFGKDSMVVLYKALQYKSDIKVVFCNTGVEFKETLQFAKRIEKEWDLNLFQTKPIKTFWQCIDEYGIPGIRGKGKNRTPKCCYYCKERPSELLYKELGITAVFTGILSTESRQRDLLAKRYDNCGIIRDGIKLCAQRYYATTQNRWKLNPIVYWSEKDVWEYTYFNKLPINPVYTKWDGIYKRCGCLPCTAYLDWERKLPISHPKLYAKLKRIQDPTQTYLSGE